MKRFILFALALCLPAPCDAGLFRNRSVKVERRNGRVVRKEVRVAPKFMPAKPQPKATPAPQPGPAVKSPAPAPAA